MKKKFIFSVGTLFVFIVITLLGSAAIIEVPEARMTMMILGGGGGASQSFPVNSVQEQFTGANDTSPYSASWNTASGTPEIQSNQAASDSGLCGAYHNDQMADTDFEIYITMSTKRSTNGDIFAFYAVEIAGIDGYGIYGVGMSGTDSIEIHRFDEGAETELSTVAQELSSGDSIGLSKVGTTLKAWYKPSAGSWSVVDTHTDATHGALDYQPYLQLHEDTTRIDDMGWGTL